MNECFLLFYNFLVSGKESLLVTSHHLCVDIIFIYYYFTIVYEKENNSFYNNRKSEQRCQPAIHKMIYCFFGSVHCRALPNTSYVYTKIAKKHCLSIFLVSSLGNNIENIPVTLNWEWIFYFSKSLNATKHASNKSCSKNCFHLFIDTWRKKIL